MKILVVDDSAVERTRLKDIIERAGHQAILAKDGEEGVAIAVRDRPNLVFMDIVMPRMDGFKATRELSARPDTRHIPVILVSTKKEAVDVMWAKRQGAASLVGKPYAPADILEQIVKFQEN
jgi:twitching motility two-component system response regulator PilH